MNNPRQEFDVLVVGGGPAGMAAAARAAQCGLKVGLVDDNAKLGGQIWRSSLAGQPDGECHSWTERIHAAGVRVVCGRVFHQPEPGVLLAESSDNLYELGYRELVVATGARERFLPFPGWTLPNVMGAGGLQAMVKAGLPLDGKRIVIAGSGPLLLAVAAYLRRHGAQIAMICEQTSWSTLVQFGVVLLRRPDKLGQAIQLKAELAGIPFCANCWPVAASGRAMLESVTISRNRRIENIPCDYLACGFHLVPNIELALLLGCETRNGQVQTDAYQRTTAAHVYCAGEPTGIGGVELAVVEGQIAGLATAKRESEARRLFARRERLRGFARALDRTFQLRPELRSLAAPETIVCRCEDVRFSHLREHSSWREAKLQTRCGMGPCQGRVCGPATEFLFGWDPDSVRPPLFPARVESLASANSLAETDD